MIEYEKVLKEYIDKDDRLVVMTAENRAPLRNIADKIGNRFIDTGITEQAMVGMAAGLALRGRKPICHALAAFLTMRAFEFIRTDVGIGALPVKLVGFVPGILSDANGPTHQAIEDVSIMRGIPGMQVFCPADEEDLIIGLRQVIDTESPCYIRYTTMKPALTHDRNFALGKAEKVFTGEDITILSYGALFEQSYLAAKALRDQGLSVGLLNLRMLKPIDENAILEAIRTSKVIVTVEDHFLTGGLATILSEICLRNRVAPQVLNIGFDNQWFRPALLRGVMDYEGLSAEKIAQKVKRYFEGAQNA